jgi:peptidoglycan hydrolase-like protein with peptidoglycan-binding domain
MRIFAALVAVILGASVAFAQGDPRAYFFGQPNGAQQAKSKAKSKAKSRSARKAGPAKAKAASQRHRAAEKPKPRSASKTASASKSTAEAKAKPATAKPAKEPAKKSAKLASTGRAGAAAPAASPSLRESYAAIPLAERVALQSDLIWTGDYNGLVTGEVSDRLVEAVKAYQKRHKAKVTGVPTPQQRSALAAAARPRQEEIGWRLVEDPMTGARVGVPTKIATRTTPSPSGTRWSSAQEQLQIETFQIDTGATLEAVFEQQKKQSRRRVTSSALHANDFVVSGTQGLKRFHVRGFAKDGEVRGITILYDQAMSGTMAPIVTAMSSAFVPFANYTVASTGSIGVARRKVEYGSGVVVSPSGHIVAARRVVDGCHVIAVPRLGNAERLAEDRDSGLALLRVYGANKLTPIGMQGEATGGGAITLVGVADPQAQGGGGAVSAVPAKLAAGAHAIEPAPAPGFSGAAAIDDRGALQGVVIQKSSLVAGLTGAPQGASLAPLSRIRSFLQSHGVAPAAGKPNVAAAKAATVRVICVRK